MADLPLLAERLFNHPHLVTPIYAQTIATILSNRLGVEPLLADPEITRRPAKSPELMRGGVLVLPVVGGLYHRGDGLDAMSGAQSYTNLQNRIAAAMEDKDVKGILLDIDSPGGQGAGCFEFCETLVSAASKKPIWSIANSLAASAAYAIACSGSRLYTSPSGVLGSIGVVVMHADLSKRMQKQGTVITHIFAGKHKVDGNPFEPLPESVRAEIQAQVDLRYEQFVSLVASRRPMKEKDIRKTEARTFLAEQAVELGLADEVASFEAVLSAFVRDLNPVYRVSPTGAVQMSTENAPASGVTLGTTPRIEGLQEALSRAREDGRAAMKAEMQTEVVNAYIRGRTDAAAIVSHEAAQGRTAAAAKMAGNGKLSVEEAVEMLSAIPVSDTASSFRAKLASDDPKVPAAAASQGSALGPISDFQQSVASHVSAILSAPRVR